LDDKSEEDFQKVSEYLIAICEFIKPVPVEKYVDMERRPQTIAWHVFAVIATAVRLTRISIIFMIIYLN
jgi:hypothetical protein